MEFFADIIFSLTGRILLLIRYRKRPKIQGILNEKYNDSYTDAGRLFIVQAFAWMVVISIAVFIAGLISQCLRKIQGAMPISG